jgi:cytochrome c-type biogenesis protein CcmE
MKKILLLLLTISVLFLTACTMSVEEVKNEKFVGESVSVKGTVEGSIKIGDLSGYTIVDDNGDKIAVSSSDLPKDGKEVVARGTLKKGLFGAGFYIDSKD